MNIHGMGMSGGRIAKDDLQCGICYETMKKVAVLTCGHVFDHHCIEEFWRNKDTQTCPSCRGTMSILPEDEERTVRAITKGKVLQGACEKQREIERKQEEIARSIRSQFVAEQKLPPHISGAVDILVKLEQALVADEDEGNHNFLRNAQNQIERIETIQEMEKKLVQDLKNAMQKLKNKNVDISPMLICVGIGLVIAYVFASVLERLSKVWEDRSLGRG